MDVVAATALEQKIDDLASRFDARFDRMDARFDRMDARFDRMEERVTQYEKRNVEEHDWFRGDIRDLNRTLALGFASLAASVVGGAAAAIIANAA